MLEKGEAYSCFFQDSHSPAVVTESGVTCHTPDVKVPMVPPGQGECGLTPDQTVVVVSATKLIKLEYNHWFELFNFGTGGFGCIQ